MTKHDNYGPKLRKISKVCVLRNEDLCQSSTIFLETVHKYEFENTVQKAYCSILCHRITPNRRFKVIILYPKKTLVLKLMCPLLVHHKSVSLKRVERFQYAAFLNQHSFRYMYVLYTLLSGLQLKIRPETGVPIIITKYTHLA